MTAPALAADPDFVRCVLHDARPVPSPRAKSNRTQLRVWQTRALTGMATWEEEDYCHPPLAQERAAVLDRYFRELAVRPVSTGSGWEEIKALPPLFPEFHTRTPNA